jgi:hypothetical protein
MYPCDSWQTLKWILFIQNTRRNLHQLLKEKQLYSALCGVYTEVLHDLMAVLKESAAKGKKAKTTNTKPPSNEEFREQRRRTRKLSDEANKRTKKPATSATSVIDPQLQSKDAVPTRNFFAPLRSTDMEADHGRDADDSTEGQQQQAPSSQAGRPPPIVLTSQLNLIQLQRQLKGLLKGNFDFRSTRNGARVVTKELANFSTICSHVESNNLPYFTFYPNPRSL